MAIVPAPVLAQTAQPGGAGETGTVETGDNGGLVDIVVTAQQRGENLQRAAVPVSVVTGADLVKSGTTGLGALTSVPALQVAAGGQGNLVFIRGVGNFSFLPSSDPAAAFNYDGIYVGRSSSTVGNFFDLERIEVLKGPQGTLYGRNATAGAINVLPVQPKLGETSGYAMASYGNYDAINAEGAVNVGLGDNAGFRLSGSYTKHDGYLRDGTTADDSGAVRAQLKVELSPALTVRLSADYAHQGGVAGGATYLGKYAFDATAGRFVVTPSGFAPGEGLSTPAASAYRTSNGAAGTLPGRFLDPLARLPYSNFDIYGAHAQIDLQTSIGTLTLIPAWRHARKDNFNVQSGQNVGNLQDSDQYSVEARLVSNPGRRIDYILGAYYFSERIDDDTHNSTGAVANFLTARYTTKSPSAYARLTFHATDWLRFTGGLRYTEDRKTFTSLARTLQLSCTVPANCPTMPLMPYTRTFGEQPVRPAVNGGTAPFAPGVIVRLLETPAAGSAKTDKLTWRGAVELDVGPSSMLYASAETGYRAGGFNNDAPYAPENITAYTIGMKNRFFGNRFQLNAELFDWKYKDQQLSFLGIDGTGRVGVITRNIGRSSIRGAEVEALARPLANTTLRAAVQYVDATYKSFVYQTPARPFVGCNVTPTGALFTVDCSGKRLFNSPKWTLNLAAQQVIPLGDLQLTIDADTQYRSSRETGFEYIAEERQGATWISNAQISLGQADGRWSIAAFVRNIENDRYQIYATPVPGSNLIAGIDATPRTYGVRLATRF
ncbi:TonB-dependent receptor [Sphingobium jiangsuense]|uniref:Iron complex outermembrane receptor protein n=2 Tax=Sphingobium jiangsuense TaxID=870476 RepID=A0A7W6FQG0_9SPHN|nr:iron complex outermembrane receptor protein [Sphingobium jiangsuense]GLS98912.1 TonB-dependent receptor [Sphingobium jiangsuense]